jgi:two-component system cell cycle response regulator
LLAGNGNVSLEIPGITAVRDLQGLSFTKKQPETSYLVMIYGEYLGRKYRIERQPILIGRSPNCNIQLVDDCVSRQHCRMIPANNGVIVSDLNSTNGTYIDGVAVHARPLRDGDRIKVGRSIFKFLTGNNIEHAYHEEIYRLTTTDGLTGAYNKRYFDEDLERELFRFLRYNRPLSLLMMDIDFFKKINDEYGHLAGDRVLSELGHLIYNNVRREDTFCRYGGEEFALLMPEMDIQKAAVVGEHLRSIVDEAQFDFEGHSMPVTISIGVATAKMEMSNPNDFVRVADERLYRAKKLGRNHVESQPPAQYAQ